VAGKRLQLVSKVQAVEDGVPGLLRLGGLVVGQESSVPGAMLNSRRHAANACPTKTPTGLAP
jgi:hypothetical protein